MRLESDIKVVEDIEKLIKSQTNHVVLDKKHNNIPCFQLAEPAVSTRRYRIFMLGYNFDVCLRYDRRNDTARFDMKDCNSQVLFVKLPKLAELLHGSRRMIFRWRDGEEMRQREINL